MGNYFIKMIRNVIWVELFYRAGIENEIFDWKKLYNGKYYDKYKKSWRYAMMKLRLEFSDLQLSIYDELIKICKNWSH